MIREVDQATGVITTVAGNGISGYAGDGGLATSAELSDPSGVAVDAAGDLFIADAGNNAIREVNPATGVITTVAGNGNAGYAGDGGPAMAAELNDPSAVAVDAAGDLFIADAGNNRVREVVSDSSGTGFGSGSASGSTIGSGSGSGSGYGSGSTSGSSTGQWVGMG